MGLHRLEKIFNPQSVAVIGASSRKGSIGNFIIKKLSAGGYQGKILPVNPKYDKVEGIRAFKSIDKVDSEVDLAVIVTPINRVAGIVKDCVKADVKTALVISAGGRETGREGRKIEAEIESEARRGGLRIVGPSSLGIIRPTQKLNAGLAEQMPYPGKLAFVSQSGAISSAMLDLSLKERMGFSYFVSVGSMLDVDFGDMVDYLGNDPEVSSILLYVENLKNIRKFMSAAREVSRVKPIVVLRAGRSTAGARATASHTGVMAGEDAVYDAAFRRSGIARVHTLDDFFDCAELLAKQSPPRGPRLVVITNSGGAGAMAADAAEEYGLELAGLSRDTVSHLDNFLPAHWSRNNPVNILRDADAERYAGATGCCFRQDDIDGMLVIINPQVMTGSAEVARALVEPLQKRSYPVFATWMGGPDVAKGIEIFNRQGIPTYGSPERAIRAFKYLYDYSKNLDMLQQIPARLPQHERPDREGAEKTVNLGLKRAGGMLTEVESKKILDFYGLPVNPTHSAADLEEALALARKIGYPLVMKLEAENITHKTEAGGVKLDLENEDQVEKAYREIMASAGEYDEKAVVRGVSLQPMVRNPELELMLGASRDAQFGPVVLFGLGGVYTEILADRSLGLVPLNQALARVLLEDTRVFRILRQGRNKVAVDMVELEKMIIRLSQLMVDFPEIRELDMNPVMVRAGHLYAVDARIMVADSPVASPAHLVLSPYPEQYESRETTKDGTEIMLRPIKPEDAPLLLDLFDNMSKESRYYRFFGPKQALSREMLVRLTQVDYYRNIVLVAILPEQAGETMLGTVQLVSDPDRTRAEFSVVVADACHGQGIGAKLLRRALEVAADYGIKKVEGEVLPGNEQMLGLGRKLGFKVTRDDADHDYRLTIEPGKHGFD